jgi:serine/threonine protein kinase
MEDMPRPGDLIAARFRIEALLGEGGMGSVYAARDESTGRAVAVKFLARAIVTNAMAVSRFMEEARATSKIEHPNVIQVIDVGREGHQPFLVMERLRGESLRDRLTREGHLAPTDALDMLIPACRGVAEAHREGVIHRDLKPDNIFLSREGGQITPKVLDFGLAKTEERIAAQLTRTGATLGTPSYMSPEQIARPRDASPRFDIYSMGVVLYETLTGRRPFDGENVLTTIRRIAEGNPTPPCSIRPDIPVRLQSIVLRAMHVDPAQRHASMNELVHELIGVRQGYGATLEVAAASLRPIATGPMSAAIPTTGPGLVGAQIPKTGGDRSKPPSTLLIAGAGALVLLAPVCLASAVAGTWLLARGSSDEASGAPGVAAEPSEPSFDLRFSGDCHVDRSIRPNVIASPTQLTIAWGHTTTLHIYSEIPPAGPQEVVNLQRVGNTYVTVVSSLTTWSSSQALTLIPSQVSGRIVFHRFQPAIGVASLEFIDVQLQGMSSMCNVSGTLRTRGPM